MKTLSGVINLNQEFTELYNFIELRWGTTSTLRELLAKVWHKALELNANNAESDYKVSNKILGLRDEQNKYFNDSLSEAEKSVVSFNHPYVLFSRELFSLKFAGEASNSLSYYDVERIMKSFLSEHADCNKAKPKGWKAFKKNYNDYDGMDSYNEKNDKNVFGGTDVEPNSRSFVLKISLPQVMYDEVCQGNKAIVVLMMAVADHARVCISHNNALHLLAEIEKVEAYFLSLKNEYPMPFLKSFENITDNAMLNHAFKKVVDDELLLTEEDFKQRVKKKEEYLALPEEEKQKRKLRTTAAVKAMIETMIESKMK